MKKLSIVFQLILLVFLAASCSTSKEARGYKKTIKGNWQLQTVVTEGIMGTVKAQVFNEADFNCFIGSTWHFVSNNSMGSYTIPATTSGCDAITRNIRWSVYEPKGAEKEFQFKRLDEKKNPMDDNNGFRLSVGSISDNSMQLRSAITFEGKPGTFVYNFVKK